MAISGFPVWLIILIIGMENVKSRMLICSEVVQAMRQSDDIEQIFQGIATKLLDLDQVGHVSIYKLDKFIDYPYGIEISGKIVADAIAPNCGLCTQEQIENILREEYQWGRDITEQIIDLYTAGVSRCKINLAEIFAGKAYLLVPIVLSENDQSNALWGFLTVHQCSGLNGEAFGAWDEDDVLTLQQIAIQIETWLFKDNVLISYQQTEVAAKNITEELLCTLEELRGSNEQLIALHQEAKYEKLRFQNLFNIAPDGYFVTDSSGKILEANQPLLGLLEISLEYILGKIFVAFVALQHIEVFYSQLNYLSFQANVKTSWEIMLIPCQSDPFPAEIIVTKNINPVTNQMQFCWIVRNISDRKLAEAAKLAEAENNAKTEFLAIMSHELRTPMNAVIGMTEILQRTSLSRQQQQYLNTIRQGGEVLLSIINNILDFSRIASGHFELEERPFKLHQCIEEVLELMASRTAEKFIELITFISLDVPQQLLGDYPRLRQILVNLVSNAIKFTESGEIVISVNSQLIDRETNTYELQFEVRDTGIGIAADAIAKLFKAFSQADNSIARQYGGTGLGLAICKQLCELMGGEIGVSSTVDEGSTFSFSVQMQAIAEDLDATNAIAPELKGKSILCVNPNSTLQQAIALYAQPWKMTIQTAYTATDALQLLTTSNFEAVLIDRQLVEADGFEIDGLELAKSIQEIFPDLILILLTPINPVLNENTNSTCFRDYVTKPISTSKLYQSFLNVFTNQEAVTFSRQNLQPIPQSSCEIDNILDDENFAKCYPFRILVVEDNPVNQKILLLMLENLGYQADAVENGQKAVNNFLSQSYDLIFMDIQMPIMNGLNATKSIRQTSNHQPWIIGLSANAFSESRDSALNAGMNDYLTKPLQSKNLIAALQKIPQQQRLFVDHTQSHIDLSILADLENSLGTEDLDGLINIYLEHSASAIAKMKDAFTKQDFVTIEAENHVLKGGSGTFGAIQLCSFCQALQSICKKLMRANEHNPEDVAKIASLLKNIEEQYSYTCQILQSRGFN